MTSEIPYEVTGRSGDAEFRKYPALVLATAISDEDDHGFNLLFAYISGSNRVQQKIAMTAPVITSRRIPMTAPVVSDAASMSFVMPAAMSRGEVPEPLDSRVRITEIPPRELAVIRFSGYARKDDIRKKEAALLSALKSAGIEPAGEPFLMRYNPPWIPGFFRRNEVAVEIRR